MFCGNTTFVCLNKCQVYPLLPLMKFKLFSFVSFLRFAVKISKGNASKYYILPQVFVHVAFSPFEAVKFRVQTQPTFVKGLVDGFPKLYSIEGLGSVYRGLVLLWGRNLPCNFSISFHYDFFFSLLGVTCLAGYTAGAVGIVISNLADNIVSSLYNKNVEIVMQAVKNIRIHNLFTRSLPVRITLVGRIVTMQWFFYDFIKVLSGFIPTIPSIVSPME
ncbi:hypothetical protein UlMin_012371 [Ulmus minor]